MKDLSCLSCRIFHSLNFVDCARRTIQHFLLSFVFFWKLTATFRGLTGLKFDCIGKTLVIMFLSSGGIECMVFTLFDVIGHWCLVPVELAIHYELWNGAILILSCFSFIIWNNFIKTSLLCILWLLVQFI